MSKNTVYQLGRAVLFSITLFAILALAPGGSIVAKAQDSQEMPPNDARVLPATVQSRQSTVERYLALAPVPSYAPGYYDTSVYMLGDVAVGIILPESEGGSENWTATEKNNVVNEIQAGLDWWKTTGGALANLNFEYEVRLDVQTSYEPISRSSSEEGLWIADVMSTLGYSSGDYWDRVYAYENDLRNHLQTDWVFTIFVVDSSADVDGEFTDSYFAYAYLGGPFMVMTYDNDGWGIEDMDKVTAHETGHIFMAGDQYGSCLSSTKYGYLGIENGNCNGNPSIMKDNSWVVDTYARGQIGWKDSDSDSIPDVMDTTPIVTLASYTPNPTPRPTLSYNGYVNSPVHPHAICAANDWCYEKDVTIQPIDSVDYRVDNGAWNPAIAQDGAYNTDVEDFSFATMPLSPGAHSIQLAASNPSGNVSATWNDSVTVGPPALSVGAGMYDDTHTDWVYVGNWTTFNASGPYNNTLHYSDTIDSFAALTFQGPQFVLTYTGYTYRGQMDVIVDNVNVGTIDQYNPGLAWQSIWVSPIFTDGPHTLKLVHASGIYVDLDAIQILQFPALGPGKYDDTNANWRYLGNWLPVTASGAYTDTITYSNAVGGSATFQINGEQFELTYTGYPTRGEVDVYVDSNPTPIATISEYDPNLVWQKTWLSPNLGEGVHTITFVIKSGYIDIDAIEVFQIAPLGAGTYDDTDPAWFYGGNWISLDYPGGGPYNSTLHYSGTIGNYAMLEFEGSQFVLTYTGYPNRGEMQVYIDNVPFATLNQFNPNLVWQATANGPSVAEETHVLKLVHASGAFVDIDAIEIIGPPDTTPPAAIDDLQALSGAILGSVDLSWTAVGDDGTTGTASTYLVRYSTSTINDDNTWNNATPVLTGIPTPQASGQTESMTVSDLTPGQVYYFAVRAQDEIPNTSAVSTVTANSSAGAFAPPPPPNDDLANATPISGVLFTDSNDYFYAATTEPGDPQIVQCNSDMGKYSIWYTYTPANDGTLIVDTYGTNQAYDTVLAVWTFGGSTFTHVACNDDANENTFLSQAVAYLDQGTTYYIEVVQYSNSPQSSPSPLDKLPVSPVDEVVLNASFKPAALKGVGKHDDSDPAWVYGGNWITYANSGPYNNSLHYSDTLGSYAALAFQGNQFVITYTGYSYRGQVDVVVDNVKVGTIDEYDPGLVYQKTWASPILTNGVHTLMLVHASGAFVDLDAVEIFQVPVSGPGKYDDTDANWGYTGSWLPLTISGAYTNTITYSNAVGSYATFLMDGTQFELTFTGYPTRGEVEVYVDNSPTPIATISEYDPNLVWQKTWLSPILGSGVHMLRFVVKSGYIDIDAIEVFQVAPLGSGTHDDNHANWFYGGDWVSLDYPSGGPYNNSLHYSGTIGNYAMLEFQGSQVNLTYTGYPNRGYLQVYIDGILVTTLNQFNPTLAWQQTGSVPPVANDTHILMLIHAGGAYVDIDAIQVLP